MQEKRVLFTRTHPRKHAQEAIFPVIYSVFCTFPTPILTPKSLQITVPPPTPPMATAEKMSQHFQRFPSPKARKPERSVRPVGTVY